LEDALVAVEAGADAVGFVFYEKSPRYVTAEMVREIVKGLPEQVEKVGVFVNESGETMEGIASEAGLTSVQVHGDLRFGLWDRVARRIKNLHFYQVVQAGELGRDDYSPGFTENLKAVFVDSGNEREPGGTGKTFDWVAANQGIVALSRRVPVVVAGGLTPENVAEAVSIFKPWGVDVSSGVEAVPGRKDAGKVKAFVAAVRGADRER
jgi:phosphoribosylanthranilate isomerase